MRNSIITQFEQRVFKDSKTHPKFRPGDTLRVNYRIEETAKGAEGEKKFRLQVFEGVCIRYKKGTVDSTFTVRKIAANSVGVERVFPMHSPFVDSIEVLAGGRVRRSRLYYLRDLSGKAARIRSRRLAGDAILKTLSPVGTDEAQAASEKPKREKTVKAPKKSAKPAKKK